MPIYDSSRNKEPPISNHAVHDRATARSLERHHQRLRMIAQQNIRPYNVGDGWSHSKPRYEHLTHNLKRAQLEGERYADISRDNQNLLRKIALMEQSAVLDPTEGTWEFAPGVRLNRFQVPVIDHCISLQPQMRGAAKVPESLNRGARKRELERITRENLGIVQRIQNCPPSEQTRLDALRAHAALPELVCWGLRALHVLPNPIVAGRPEAVAAAAKRAAKLRVTRALLGSWDRGGGATEAKLPLDLLSKIATLAVN